MCYKKTEVLIFLINCVACAVVLRPLIRPSQKVASPHMGSLMGRGVPGMCCQDGSRELLYIPGISQSPQKAPEHLLQQCGCFFSELKTPSARVRSQSFSFLGSSCSSACFFSTEVLCRVSITQGAPPAPKDGALGAECWAPMERATCQQGGSELLFLHTQYLHSLGIQFWLKRAINVRYY